MKNQQNKAEGTNHGQFCAMDFWVMFCNSQGEGLCTHFWEKQQGHAASCILLSTWECSKH